MILGKQLLLARNTEPKRHARSWNRLNPKNMKRAYAVIGHRAKAQNKLHQKTHMVGF